MYSYPTFTLADGYPRVTTSYITSSSLLYISTVFEVLDLLEISGPPVSRCTTHCGPCTIERFAHGEIQLLYRPTEKQMNQSRSNENKSASAIFHGYTLYSPTVYVSFNNLHATDICGQVGNTQSMCSYPSIQKKSSVWPCRLSLPRHGAVHSLAAFASQKPLHQRSSQFLTPSTSMT